VDWSFDVIQFSLDARSGVSPYLQVVQQVRQAMRLGLLREGDQLPTVKDVVASLAINPNTVLKAYRELERDGLVVARQGVGTFVTRTLTDASLAAHEPLRRDLVRWLTRARRAGLDDESIEALIANTFRATAEQDIA
jgi:GntR family transcriptional regulator